MKSISGYEIVGDDPEAVAYIKEHEERWDIKSLLFEVSMNNFISGVMIQVLKLLVINNGLNIINKPIRAGLENISSHQIIVKSIRLLISSLNRLLSPVSSVTKVNRRVLFVVFLTMYI